MEMSIQSACPLLLIDGHQHSLYLSFACEQLLMQLVDCCWGGCPHKHRSTKINMSSCFTSFFCLCNEVVAPPLNLSIDPIYKLYDANILGCFSSTCLLTTYSFGRFFILQLFLSPVVHLLDLVKKPKQFLLSSEVYLVCAITFKTSSTQYELEIIVLFVFDLTL